LRFGLALGQVTIEHVRRSIARFSGKIAGGGYGVAGGGCLAALPGGVTTLAGAVVADLTGGTMDHRIAAVG
jgi:hypothetical protein